VNEQMGIQCRRADNSISDRQLQQIAGLIYDTDPHIYPAMFKDRQEAEMILPRMIRSEDQMFRTDNLFIALDGHKIIGVLLWKRGPMQWNTAVYKKCGGNAEYIARVVQEYFNLFAETAASTASIVRIGVQKDMRGNHTGRLLMETFMREEPGPYELYVLMKNTDTIRFFEGMGFSIRETRPGFSLDYSEYPCFWMIR
jgi:ribosomal protein S18 acetylase RimI-like enzyme